MKIGDLEIDDRILDLYRPGSPLCPYAGLAPVTAMPLASAGDADPRSKVEDQSPRQLVPGRRWDHLD